jgi:N-acetylglucosamine kinase-like BadF-type ATPase
MTGWLVGVDGGGTTTRVAALEMGSGTVRDVRADGCNWTVHGSLLCRERVEAAVREALPPGERPAGLAVCLAGFYPPDHGYAVYDWIRGSWPGVPVAIGPDYLAAWAASHGGAPGLVLIAGTGSICYGRVSRGVEARAGGWGPLFGDAGSAYAVGVAALRALADFADGMGPESRLAEQVMERWPELGSNLVMWLRGVYRMGWGREEVAALSTEVSAAADLGDRVAVRILGEAAAELARMASAVAARLGSTPLPLALYGGLASSRVVREGVAAAVAAEERLLELTVPSFAAVDGALLLAAEELAPEGVAAVREMLRGIRGDSPREQG